MRKLAFYEKQNVEEEFKRKQTGFVSKNIDENIRQNVIKVLEQLNYSY